jgi:hypothetical protein
MYKNSAVGATPNQCVVHVFTVKNLNMAMAQNVEK